MALRNGHQIPWKRRREVLARDSQACRKCGGGSHLAVHHIVAIQDGGSDEAENLITLCTVCHMEWHMVETGRFLSFDKWLTVPGYSVLLAAYLAATPEIKNAIDTAWSVYRMG